MTGSLSRSLAKASSYSPPCGGGVGGGGRGLPSLEPRTFFHSFKTQNHMEQPTKPHKLMTARPQRFQIEQYALLTESAVDLRERLEEWYDYYQPTSPGECEQLELAVMASIQRRRVLGQITELANQRIRTAFFDFNCAQENDVERYRAMLATSPGAAILGLKRSALGIRYLVMRWERLESLLERDGTWYGGDRNEAINYQGARADPPESLSESEAGYLTWLYCLMTAPATKDAQFAAIGQPSWTPSALYDREPRDWLGEPPVCRKILADTVQRELAALRQREQVLRCNHEEPARDGAEIRRQVLTSPDGMLLLRHERAHGLVYDRAYGAFVKGRLQSLKTGLPPGAPVGVDHAEAEPTSGAVPSDRAVVAERRTGRMRAAEAVAPGAGNGIGAPPGQRDVWVDEVMAARPTPYLG
jgi:hypothetical protein